MGLEDPEARLREGGFARARENASAEVLVTEGLRHVHVEDRVVPVALDDQSRSLRLEHTPVLGEGASGIVHVVERVLRVDQVELAVRERKLLTVRDLEAKAVAVGPCGDGLDVDRDHLADALAQEPRDAAVAAADVEQALVAAKAEAELVDAAQAVSELAGSHGAPMLA